MSACQQCEMPLGSTQADECQVCSAYLAGRRSAFRSIARWARKEAARFDDIANKALTANDGEALDAYERIATEHRLVAREAERRARGAS